MGCRNLWRFFASKKHHPQTRYLRHQHRSLSEPGGKVLIDVQGSIFPTIRYAYSHCRSLEDAHKVVVKRIKQIGTRERSVLYFDGELAEEKQQTHQLREKTRNDALKVADVKVAEFSDRVENGERIRRQHFVTINKNLNKGFHWELEARSSLIAFLKADNRTVRQSLTEADVLIAAEFVEGDIVVSGDSDMAVHPRISMIWRPISKGRFLEYNMQEVLAALGITRIHLTILGIVSHNDYNNNIYGLGCATNFGIIKGEDISAMAAAYLADPKVIMKNKENLDFASSIKVFAFGQQTAIARQEPDPGALSVKKIKAKFVTAQQKYAERKKKSAQARQAAKSASGEDRVYRHKPSQKFNPFRSIDRPPPRKNAQTRNRITAGVSPQPRQAAPPTPRPRYSIKSHERKKHDPPAAMKQYKLKPWKCKTEEPDNPTSAPVSDASNEPKPPRRGPTLPAVDRMNKSNLLKAMAWEHPYSWLEIGTVAVNVEALKVKDENRDPVERAEDIQVAEETIRCLKDISREANRTKRKCQQLLGAYVDRLRIDGPSPDDKKFLDLLCPPIPRRDSNINSSTSGNANSSTSSKNPLIINADPDPDDKPDNQTAFIACFMRYLYSNNFPHRQGIGIIVDEFIRRLETLRLHHPLRNRGEINVSSEFQSTPLVRSAATQVCVEMKNMYWRGSYALLDQLKAQYERDYKLDASKNKNDAKDVDTSGSSGSGQNVSSSQQTTPTKVDNVLKKTTLETKEVAMGEVVLKDEDTSKSKNETNNLSDGFTLSIQSNLSAIENFLALNKLVKNPRGIIPMSRRLHGFMSFTESELLALFCGRPVLEKRMRWLSRGAFSDVKKAAIDDLEHIWLSTKEPGYLVKALLADVGPKELSVRQRGKRGYRGAIRLSSMDELKDHVRLLREGNIDPRTYDVKGYTLRGSIRTDGFRLQLLSFKLKELQRVRYKRPSPDYPLSPQLTSVVGGTDYFLTEIRNVTKTPEDVARLWPDCPPDQINILCIDLGQAFVVGANAQLQHTDGLEGSSRSSSSTEFSASTFSTPLTHASDPSVTPSLASGFSVQPSSSSSSSSSMTQSTVFHNLAVSQKAVYQPTFKHRHWTEQQRKIVPEGFEDSIEELESNLPPLRGKDASVIEYLAELSRVQDQLDTFYNGGNLLWRRRAWDAERAKQEEFRTIANRLLGAVGGSIGRKRKEGEMVVIGIGLGKFKSNSKLTSLHESFMSFFVQLARSLDYIVVGVNEFFTSKKCPVCHEFVCQVNIRRLYCKNCRSFVHRDILAAHNMTNIVKGYLEGAGRPDYLQPVDENGGMPWKKDDGGSGSPQAQAPPTPSRPAKKTKAPTAQDPGSNKRPKLSSGQAPPPTPSRAAKRSKDNKASRRPRKNKSPSHAR